MERKQMAYWAAQIIGWGTYHLLAVAIILSQGDLMLDGPLMTWIVLSIIGCILITHVVRWFILRLDIVRARILRIVISVLLLSTFGALLLESYQYLLDILTGLIDNNPEVNSAEEIAFTWPSFFMAVLRSTILFMVWIGFYIGFVTFERVRTQEIERLKYGASMTEIELKNLREQLNPHFLFNSLNSIRALVGIDPEQAKDAVTKLSSLLRLSINMGKQGETTIKEEMELVSNYLKLEKIRFEERLEVEVKMNQEAATCKIPPLMIQTLVENAIKHGISKSINGGVISIEIQCNGSSLIGHVKNTGTFNPDPENMGIGLANTKKRLELLYGDKAEFSITQVGEKVHADFSIFYDKK